MLELCGLVCFTLALAMGPLTVAAVTSTQFGTFAVILGVVLLHERPRAPPVGGARLHAARRHLPGRGRAKSAGMSDFFNDRRPGEPGQRMARARRLAPAHARRRRLFALAALVLVVAAAVALAVLKPWRDAGSSSRQAGSTTLTAGSQCGPRRARLVLELGGPAAAATPSPTRHPSPSASPSASPSPSSEPTPSPSQIADAPPIVQDLVPYGPRRKAEMAAYSRRHYGQATWVLHPQAIVLHYTATSTYAAAHNTFASNAPALGELPGVAAHFVIDENGTIYQQVPLDVRCRHAIGLDWCAIGIEFVQPAGSGPAWAIAQIFSRTRQLDAGLRLVAWLEASYGISATNVIGHAMANDSPLFKDLLGWRNDHQDWNAAAVARFKQAMVKAE